MEIDLVELPDLRKSPEWRSMFEALQQETSAMT